MSSKAESIAVGMSGGTDSSVTAAILVDKGFDVLGVTALMCDGATGGGAPEAADKAAAVCRHLGINHVVVDMRQAFAQKVLRPFAGAYAHGETPSPCVGCNETIKFGALLEHVTALGCNMMATGHYAQILHKPDGYHLLRGRDRSRDQSYFLHRLCQQQLALIMMPLGDRLKQDDVIPFARQRRIPVATDQESRDVCFAPPGRHHELVERFFPDANRPGDIVTLQGEVVGRHNGIHRCTIGQRRGLGLAGGPPLYVAQIDAAQNRVIVGSREDATTSVCVVRDCHWISGRPPRAGNTFAVSIRYQHGPVPCTVDLSGTQECVIRFDEPQFGVAPGQAAVLYCGDEVAGGGWIAGGREHEQMSAEG